MVPVRAAIGCLVERHPTALFVATCGYISRDLYHVADRPEHFYLVGSMGLAAPVALGIALGQPHRRVVVLDGDGSFGMNLSCLPMIGDLRPDLIHVLLDNGRHESTGGQRTVGLPDPAATALACGYAEAHTITDEAALARVDPVATPALLHVRCPPRDHPIGARIALTPPELVERFRSALTPISGRNP